MKYILSGIILLALVGMAQSLSIESITVPQSVKEGESFEFSASIRNTGSQAAGSDLTPIIATLVSSKNCIINSAKIIGKLAPGESKPVSWIVTAPSAGTCSLSVSASISSATYAADSRTVSISSTESGGAGSGSAGGGDGTDAGSSDDGIGNTTTTLDSMQEPIQEKESAEEEGPESPKGSESSDTDATETQTESPYIFAFIIPSIILALAILYLKIHQDAKHKIIQRDVKKSKQ